MGKHIGEETELVITHMWGNPGERNLVLLTGKGSPQIYVPIGPSRPVPEAEEMGIEQAEPVEKSTPKEGAEGGQEGGD